MNKSVFLPLFVAFFLIVAFNRSPAKRKIANIIHGHIEWIQNTKKLRSDISKKTTKLRSKINKNVVKCYNKTQWTMNITSKVGISYETINIQNERITLQIPTDCNDPYYIVRSFGKNAMKFKRKTFNEWISYKPISGTSIIDVTLITCNAFNVEDYFNHKLPNPVVLYRNQHYFELRNQTNINVWERIDANLPIHINTRYQLDKICQTKKTRALCSLSAIDSYTYKSEEVGVQKSICFVGASHVRKLNDEAKKMGMKSYYIKVKYIRDLASLANITASKCEIVFIHTGQWDLGWPENKLTPIQEYKRYLQNALKAFKEKKYDTYLLSNNYNPLGRRIMNGRDWRRPDFIDKYNSISKIIAEIYDVTYIDNNYEVGGAAWDSASDWCHYDPKVMRAVLMNTLRHIHLKVN